MTIADWSDLMGSLLTVRNPSTGVGGAFGGQPYSTAEASYPMHYRTGSGNRRYTEGLTAAVSGIGWIASTSTGAIRLDSQFTLPDGTRPPCLRVHYERDTDGTVHHTVAVFG